MKIQFLKYPRSAAAISTPILICLIIAFLFCATTGVLLWLWHDERLWRVLHEWSVPPMLILFGVVWRMHALRGWRMKKNRASGSLIITILVASTISGWMVNYIDNKEWQEISGDIHTWIGMSAIFLLTMHAILGLLGRETKMEAKR